MRSEMHMQMRDTVAEYFDIGDVVAFRAVASLIGFTVLFAVFALWGYRRDEGKHYR